MRASVAKDLWLEELRVRSCSPATLTAYSGHLGEALPAMESFLEKDPGTLTLSEITRDCVVHALGSYRSRRDRRTQEVKERSAASVGQHLGAVKSFLSWCVLTEKLGRNVALTVRAPRAPQRIPKALPADACRAVVEAAGASRWPERDRLIVLSSLAMGLRLAELTGVELTSFSPSAAAPTHLKVLGKGSKERTVPVPGGVREALGSYLPTRTSRLQAVGLQTKRLFLSSRVYATSAGPCVDITRDGVAQVFERSLQGADLKAPGIRVHAARHSFATAGISSRVFDLEEMRTLLGHTSVATTQVYLRVDPERLGAAAELHPLANLFSSR